MYNKSNFTEIKRSKIIVNRTTTSSTYKLVIPKRWCESIGLSQNDKDIKIIFENEERIIIEKF